MYYYINHPVFYYLKEFVERERVSTQPMEKKWEIYFPKYFLFTKNKINPNQPSIVHSPWIHDIPWKIKANKLIIEEFIPFSKIQTKMFEMVSMPFKHYISLTPATHKYLLSIGKESILLPPLLKGRLVKRKKDYVVGVMWLKKVKNPEIIAALAKEYPKTDFKILTSGLYEERYLKMLDLPNVEIIKERLELSKAREIIKYASLLVLPSWREAIGFSVVEALSFGTPVMVSSNAGISSYFPEKGWVIHPGKKKEWVEKMECYYGNNPEEYYELFKGIFSKGSAYASNYEILRSYLKSFV